MKKITLAISVLAIVCIVSAVGLGISALSANQTIKHDGNIKTIGVACNTTTINWGTFNVGESKTYNVEVWASGSRSVTLTFLVQNWVPTIASSYVAVSWNYATGTPVTHTHAVITVTIAVSDSIPDTAWETWDGTFGCDMVITGTEV